MKIFNYESFETRAKTPPPDEEANCDENDTVDGGTQGVPAGNYGPDPDRDSEDQGQEHSGRYKWDSGETIRKKEENA